MREAFYPTPRPVEEQDVSEDRKVGCVANTVVSICSRISGIDFPVPDIYYQWRGMMLRDMANLYLNHRRRGQNLPREHYEAANLRLDQRAFTKFIETVKAGRGIPLEATVLQTVLQDTEIEYKRGGIEEIKKEIDLGNQVAATFKVTDDVDDRQLWHIAHVGYEGNQFVSYSDGNMPLAPADINEIGIASDYLNNTVRTWNFVSVRKFGD